MNTVFIVSVVGTDRPGLIKELAAKSHAHDGKWLKSKVCHLEGQFSAIIKIEVPEAEAEAVRTIFSSQPSVVVQFSDVVAAADDSIAPFKIRVDANDRFGLVNDITELLDQQGVVVANLECHRFGVQDLSANFFTANIDLHLPAQLDEASLISDIEALGEDIVVKQVTTTE